MRREAAPSDREPPRSPYQQREASRTQRRGCVDKETLASVSAIRFHCVKWQFANRPPVPPSGWMHVKH